MLRPGEVKRGVREREGRKGVGVSDRAPLTQIIERCSAEVGRMKQTEELIRLTQRLRFHKVKVSLCLDSPPSLSPPCAVKEPEPPPCFLPGPAPGLLVEAPGVAGGADGVRVPERGHALHLAPPLHSPLPAAL